ncbi:MAG: hypothetical protein JW793_14985 [Acidobacteria bacterium]|nr:hypothetical protein [Acidobacteriota bacterium]
MERKTKTNVEDYTELYGHKAFRPLTFFKDDNGYGWLCDKSIDPHKDLRKQGCWRCDEMAFPTGGR